MKFQMSFLEILYKNFKNIFESWQKRPLQRYKQLQKD